MLTWFQVQATNLLLEAFAYVETSCRAPAAAKVGSVS